MPARQTCSSYLMSALASLGVNSTAVALDLRPESGVWFETSDRTRSGLMITQQSNSVAVGLYTYDDAGNPTWSLAVGAVRDGILEAPLITYTGGVCITCEAGSEPATEAGSQAMRIEFLPPTRGILTIDGESVAIQSLSWIGYLPMGLQNDASPFVNVVPELVGTWVFTSTEDASTFHQRNVFLGVNILDPPGFDFGDFSYVDARASSQGKVDAFTCIGLRLTNKPGYCVLEEQVFTTGVRTPILTALVADIGPERMVAYEGGPVFDEQGNAIRGENLVYGFRIPNVPIDRTEGAVEVIRADQ